MDLGNPYNWWTYVPGANWLHPRGPGSSVMGLADHPGVQLAWSDVEAYADWAGKSLRTARNHHIGCAFTSNASALIQDVR